MAETKMPTPPGYQQLVPFDKDVHRDLGLIGEQQFSFAASLHAIYLSAVEFMQAVHHFPIIFSATSDNDVVPMVVTGLKAQQNLFLTEDGVWLEGTYIPAYLRRYPFYTAQIRHSEQTEEHIICVDPAGLMDSSDPLMDADGNTTEKWGPWEDLIRNMEIARQKTQQFTAALTEHDLFETFEAELQDDKGAKLHISGMLRVSEDKLKSLSGNALQALMESDFLFLIHLHRMSLDNFRLLVDRANALEIAAS